MISVILKGQETAVARLTRIRANLADLSPALLKAGVYVRDRAIWRIKTQGGDQSWPPTKRGGHMGIDTGRMWQSIGISQSDARSITVGTNVFYAKYFQRGHGPFTVRPKAKKFLRFVSGGTTYFAKQVTVGAQPPRPFLLLTDDDRAKIRAIFVRYIKAQPIEDAV